MDSLQRRIHTLHAAGDSRGAATAAVEGYGEEILGFLVTLLRDENDASEVFSQACEDLWNGLARFEGRASIRTWFYTLARHAAARFRRSPHRRPEHRITLGEAEAIAQQVRSRTLPHLRTDVKDRFAAIRDALDEEARALLVLRVDREMSWNEIAHVLAHDEVVEHGAARVAARLRQRFQSVKDDIRNRAREAGLLDLES